MKKHLKYKDYFGTVDFNLDDMCLHGKIIGINDLVSYEGNTIDELTIAYEQAVDDYLITCEELEKEPNKFFNGVFNVRAGSPRHRSLVIIADKENLKLNELVNLAFDYLIENEDKVLQ